MANKTITNPGVIAKIPVDYFEKIRNITENQTYKKMQLNKNEFAIEDYAKSTKEIQDILDSFISVMKEMIVESEKKTASVSEVD